MMNIYKVSMDLSLVMPRLRKIRLGEYNSERPIIFVEAKDPDEACYLAYHRLAEIILKQDSSTSSSLFVKEIFHDIRIKKLMVPQ